MSLNDARARLKAHFASDDDDGDDDVISTHTKKWSELWDQGDFLPWDRGVPNPALVDLLLASSFSSSSSSDPGGLHSVGSCFVDDDDDDDSGGRRRKRKRKRKKALVPGCGRGYDVLLLAAFGYDAVGLEVSEGAVRRCWEEVGRVMGGDRDRDRGVYAVRDEGEGGVGFLRGDFFAWEGEWVGGWDRDREGGGFDLIYDYTVGGLRFIVLR